MGLDVPRSDSFGKLYPPRTGARDASSTTSDALRRYLFRQEPKTGLRELFLYLRIRMQPADAQLWPQRPQPSLIGLKNMLRRLAHDLSVLETLTGQSTKAHVAVLDQAFFELQAFLLMGPPHHLREDLGSDLVSAYICLSLADNLLDFDDISEQILFCCRQTLHGIIARREMVKFEDDIRFDVPWCCLRLNRRHKRKIG
ncbi:hypothetical protein BCR37DRAFT_240801 [Protomyces lactucae-debilis]|uniref:Uncharacterized protein n=1 Tax=Protomyces lactucae-debilis TaxID=2754530 RepID=A0A1Y2FQN3_PROLT|nr:uncharacterized protein BCR37DRAFT_240801 [Protomyces lactucae-debilis]ORY85516.1 hypothetical protein BCR37DRAFT_240801 [Protomyces lactucae-debilis]